METSVCETAWHMVLPLVSIVPAPRDSMKTVGREPSETYARGSMYAAMS